MYLLIYYFFFKCTFCYLIYYQSPFHFYFLFSFLLYYTLPSIFILLSLSSSLFPLFRVVPYINCTTSSRLLYWIFISFFPFPFPFFLFIPFFSISLHVPTQTHARASAHKHTHTHTNTNTHTHTSIEMVWLLGSTAKITPCDICQWIAVGMNIAGDKPTLISLRITHHLSKILWDWKSAWIHKTGL
jgi:hypothetical protein